MAQKKPKLVTVVRVEQDGGAAQVGKLGPVMGPHGVNIVQVVKLYDEATREFKGLRVPADVLIYEDRSVEVVAKKPTTASLLKNRLNLRQGATKPGHDIVGTVSSDELRKVATIKFDDLNTDTIEHAMRIVAGTARSMGLRVVS